MTLELNLTAEDRADEGFKVYPGSVIAQRPLIVAANRILMRTAHLMGMRILHPESDWMTNYFDCDDCPVYSSDGKHLKIGSRGELKPYEAYGTFANGAVEFDEQMYQCLPWRELKKENLIHDREFSESEAKASPVWLELSQRNQGLLDAYVHLIYVYGRFQTAMDVYVDSQLREKAWMRAWYVDRLVDGRRSGAYGSADLDFDVGCLVGIAPEALVRLERRLLEEKGIQVDFVRALTEGRGEDTRKVETPVEVKSENGFQMERRYDIEIGDAGNYVREEDVLHAVNVVESGGKYSSELMSDLRQTLERNLRKGKGEKNE